MCSPSKGDSLFSSETLRPEGWIHRYPITVQFDEVDQYGIVHHTRYFVYMERARVALLGELGMRPGGLEETQLGLIVASIETKFKGSGLFLDELVVEQGCRAAGASRVQLSYAIRRGEQVLTSTEMVLAFVGKDGRPCRAPASIRDNLKRMGIPS